MKSCVSILNELLTASTDEESDIPRSAIETGDVSAALLAFAVYLDREFRPLLDEEVWPIKERMRSEFEKNKSIKVKSSYELGLAMVVMKEAIGSAPVEVREDNSYMVLYPSGPIGIRELVDKGMEELRKLDVFADAFLSTFDAIGGIDKGAPPSVVDAFYNKDYPMKPDWWIRLYSEYGDECGSGSWSWSDNLSAKMLYQHLRWSIEDTTPISRICLLDDKLRSRYVLKIEDGDFLVLDTTAETIIFTTSSALARLESELRELEIDPADIFGENEDAFILLTNLSNDLWRLARDTFDKRGSGRLRGSNARFEFLYSHQLLLDLKDF